MKPIYYIFIAFGTFLIGLIVTTASYFIVDFFYNMYLKWKFKKEHPNKDQFLEQGKELIKGEQEVINEQREQSKRNQLRELERFGDIKATGEKPGTRDKDESKRRTELQDSFNKLTSVDS